MTWYNWNCKSEENFCSNFYGDQIECPCDANSCESSCSGTYDKITSNGARQGKHCSMKLLFYKNDDCTTSDCSFKYKISRQTTTSMSLANYKRSFRINECIELEDARKMLKSNFFDIEKSGSKYLEDGPNENAIEICCPAYSVWKSYFDQNKIVEPNSTKAGFQIQASDWLISHRFDWLDLKTL